MEIDQIRRDALGLWLRGVRLPLTAVERLARPEEAASWPPAVAFAKGEAAVKGLVGRLTGDQVLIGVANLQRAEVSQRQQVVAKQLEAEATRAEARLAGDVREAGLERQRQQAEQRAQDRQQKLEQDKRAAEQRVAQRAAKKQAVARKQAAARQNAIDAQATKAEAGRLRKEAQALQAKKRAVEAQGAVLDLDKAIRTKKAARRAG